MQTKTNKPLLPFWASILVLVQFVKITYVFRKIDFQSALPIVNVDFLQYFARIDRAHQFLKESGRYWGFDPLQMAGYISGPYLDVGTYFISIFTYPFTAFLPLGKILLFVSYGSYLFIPFLVLLVIRNFGGTWQQAWMAFAINVVMFGNYDHLSSLHLRVGLFGYQTASFVALYQISLLWKWTQERKWLDFVLMTLVTAILFQIHAAIVLFVIFPNVFLYLSRFRSFVWKEHLMLGTALALVFFANWYWIHPFLHFSSWMGVAPYLPTKGIFTLWEYIRPLQYGQVLWGGFFISLLCFYAVFGWLWKIRKKEKALSLMVFCWILYCSLLACFGSEIDVIRNTQPGRVIFPFMILLYTLAGFLLGEKILEKAKSHSLFASLCIFTLVLPFSGYLGGTIYNIPELSNRLPENDEKLVEYLEKGDYKDYRILIECNDIGRPHLADLIPKIINSPVIGGPHPGVFTKTRSTLFMGKYLDSGRFVDDDPILFDKSLKLLSEKEFSNLMDFYNVGKIVVLTPLSTSYLKKFSTILTLIETIDGYTIFEVNRDSNWFFEGSGDVQFALDKVKIDNASKGNIVLKLHYADTLGVNPAMPISPVFLGDDPIPFLSVDNKNGESSILISNKGL